MGKYRLYLDTFSGVAADLPNGKRKAKDILAALVIEPRVSTFDMSEHRWLYSGITELKNDGYIVELNEPYPWHRYMLTEKARAEIGKSVKV